MIHCKAGLAGRYRMVATNAKTGKQRVLADWFPNLITDYGLNILGAESWDNLEYCQVGSGTAAPTNADTALASLVASSNTQQVDTSGAQGSAPYYGWRRRVVRFAEGVAAGNLTEVGMTANLTTASLFSRALILDGNGNPTTITVLADEFLDVTYELRLYPPLTDVVEVVADGATSYTVTTRASDVTTTGSQFSESGWGNEIGRGVAAMSSIQTAYDGAIGAITIGPSGASVSSQSITQNSYQNNSLERTASILFGLNDANFATGVRSIKFRPRRFGYYQSEFDPPIAKANTQELTIGFKVSWGRYVP